MAKSKKYNGIYTVRGKKGVRYGIDYIAPDTGLRIRKIVKNARSEADALQARSIEIADAARGTLDRLYQLKVKLKPVLFEDVVKEYLEWSKGNKKSWDDRRAQRQTPEEDFRTQTDD